jgi:hypothetical protein
VLFALEKQIEAKNAPKWAQDVDAGVLRILSQLGNGVLHTNGGDITLQENATPELLEQIALAFEELLDYVYERPAAGMPVRRNLSTVFPMGKSGAPYWRSLARMTSARTARMIEKNPITPST